MADRYVAKTDLYVGDPGRGARAHVAGDEVPESNVKANGWTELVEKVSVPADAPAGAAAAKVAAKD